MASVFEDLVALTLESQKERGLSSCASHSLEGLATQKEGRFRGFGFMFGYFFLQKPGGRKRRSLAINIEQSLVPDR